jgi:hypothetical protein
MYMTKVINKKKTKVCFSNRICFFFFFIKGVYTCVTREDQPTSTTLRTVKE